jgi:hypothetical protein
MTGSIMQCWCPAEPLHLQVVVTQVMQQAPLQLDNFFAGSISHGAHLLCVNWPNRELPGRVTWHLHEIFGPGQVHRQDT